MDQPTNLQQERTILRSVICNELKQRHQKNHGQFMEKFKQKICGAINTKSQDWRDQLKTKVEVEKDQSLLSSSSDSTIYDKFVQEFKKLYPSQTPSLMTWIKKESKEDEKIQESQEYQEESQQDLYMDDDISGDKSKVKQAKRRKKQKIVTNSHQSQNKYVCPPTHPNNQSERQELEKEKPSESKNEKESDNEDDMKMDENDI